MMVVTEEFGVTSSAPISRPSCRSISATRVGTLRSYRKAVKIGQHDIEDGRQRLLAPDQRQAGARESFGCR